MPTLILLRHGQASFGTGDYDRLSPTGERQAELAAEALHRGTPGITRIASGDLRRQVSTARPLVAATGVEPVLDPRWNEYGSGDVLGAHGDGDLSVDAPGTLDSRAFQDVLDGALRRWIDAGTDSPAAESWPAFHARATGALSDALEGLGSGETAVCVTSGGVIAAVCAELLGGGIDTFLRLNRVGVNAGTSRVVRGRGAPSLITFNEHAVLSAAGPGLVTYR